MTRGAARAMTLVAAALLLRAGCDGEAAPRRAARALPATGAARLLHGAPLDANREPPEVLALLPGIGPARAAAIVAARPHCSLDDLDRIAGIGTATLRALAPRLAFPGLPSNCRRELQPLRH